MIREKDPGRVWRNPCVIFLMISFLQCRTKYTFRPAVRRQQFGCDVSFQGSPLEIWCLWYCVGHIDTLCLAHKLQTPRRKAGVQHKAYCKPYCLCEHQGTVSHSYQLTVHWKHSKSQVPRHWPRAHLVSRSTAQACNLRPNVVNILHSCIDILLKF